uniref:Uncharacterized protein n=1 Tax=Heterorhabditis bacteriophora TaxID=37862 RepID=A0A1I7XA41_HETBA
MFPISSETYSERVTSRLPSYHSACDLQGNFIRKLCELETARKHWKKTLCRPIDLGLFGIFLVNDQYHWKGLKYLESIA